MFQLHLPAKDLKPNKHVKAKTCAIARAMKRRTSFFVAYPRRYLLLVLGKNNFRESFNFWINVDSTAERYIDGPEQMWSVYHLLNYPMQINPKATKFRGGDKGTWLN